MHWFIEKIKTYYPITLQPIANPGETVQIDLKNPLSDLLSIVEFGGVLTFDDIPKILEIDSGFLLNTSGSTGTPKIALYSFNKFLEKFRHVSYNPIKTVMIMGLDHIGGIDVYFSVISRGGTIIFPDEKTPAAVCKIIQDEKIQFISLTATFLNMILLSEAYLTYDLSSLKTINFGAEPMPASLLQRLQKVFPQILFKQTFGTTETGTLEVKRHPDNPLFIKIKNSKVIDGKLYIKSDFGMLRYLEQPSPLIDGYFPTGDLVQQEEGYLKIIGRENDVINIGGNKVSPAEIEEMLISIPFVKDVVVYGEKNLITGNILVADVVWESEEDCSRYIKFALKGIDKYKIPSKIKNVKEINHSARMKKIRLKL